MRGGRHDVGVSYVLALKHVQNAVGNGGAEHEIRVAYFSHGGRICRCILSKGNAFTVAAAWDLGSYHQVAQESVHGSSIGARNRIATGIAKVQQQIV